MNIKILATLFYLTSLTAFSQSIFPFSKDDLWGYMDTTGKVVLEPQYPMAGFFNEGLAYVQIGDALGYINEEGIEMIDAIYPAVTNFNEGYACVMVDEDWMVIDITGNFPFETYFANYISFHDGLARFKLERGLFSTYGFINTYGDTAIYPEYELVSEFSEGLCMAALDKSTYGYINTKGEWVIKPELELGGLFKFNDEYDFTDKNFSDGYVSFKKGDFYGVMDKTGTVILDCKFEFIGAYNEGFAPAKKKGKFGYIDITGKWIVKPKYTGAEKFSYGLGAVSKGPMFEPKWGFVDHSGKLVIPITIDSYYNIFESMHFSNGYLPCYIEQGVFGYINRKGEVIWKNK